MFRLTSCLAFLVVLIGVGQVSGTTIGSSYSEVVLADNPIGYWRLGEDGGGIAQDASGNELHGLYLEGVTLGEQGALLTDSDTSALLDGQTGFVDVGTRPSLNQLTNDFTIEAWVKHQEGTRGTIVNTRGPLSGSGSGYAFGLTDPGNTGGYPPYLPYLSFFGKPGHVLYSPIPSGEWTHLAVALDSSNDATFYINGESQGTMAGESFATPNSQTFNIGRQPVTGVQGHQSYFGGGLDEVAIYGRSLAPEEIMEHYLAAVPEPSTLALLCMGAVGLITYGWRRRRTA